MFTPSSSARDVMKLTPIFLKEVQTIIFALVKLTCTLNNYTV